jgi:DNA-binding HxlR family transcriptional regulator
MDEGTRLKIDLFCDRPTTARILLALLEKEEAYQFQLVRIVGTQPRSISEALEVLIEKKLVKPVQPKHKIGCTGDYYSLTPHGQVVANMLRELGEIL